jgi:ABC-type antimicrobial peptide transport system permease subunit
LLLLIGSALAHGVSARRRELGIRIALGASSRAVAELVAGQVIGLTVVGLSIGLPGRLCRRVTSRFGSSS